MQNDYKMEQELGDRKSQTSAKHSRSKKIKKPLEKQQRIEKDKEKNPKITYFFKKILTDNQKAFAPSSKKQFKRSPQDQIKLQQLQHQQRQLLHDQELLKKEIQTLKSEQQIMLDEANNFTKKVKFLETVSIREKYEFIRFQKQVPDLRKIQSEFLIGWDHGCIKKHQQMRTLEINDMKDKIRQKKQILNFMSKNCSSIPKRKLQEDIKNLETELSVILSQNQQYYQKTNLAVKQKTCKFALYNWPLINKKYQSLQLIGGGGYSEVYKAVNITTGQMVAVKLCSVAEMAQVSSQIYLKHLRRQCQTHKNLQHQNIVKLIEVIEFDKSEYCLILEYCQGPQLSKYLKRKHLLTQNQAKQIMFQVFQTLYYLNSFSKKKIVHYDLKPQNIMFHQGRIKILDFGLTKQIEEQQSRAALTSLGMGTHVYLPPEINEYDQNDDRVLTCKVDIWSAGTIFYELLFGRRPSKIEDLSPQNLLSNISQQSLNLIRKCLKIDPIDRISPSEVYFHSYFNQFQRQYQRK